MVLWDFLVNENKESQIKDYDCGLMSFYDLDTCFFYNDSSKTVHFLCYCFNPMPTRHDIQNNTTHTHTRKNIEKKLRIKENKESYFSLSSDFLFCSLGLLKDTECLVGLDITESEVLRFEADCDWDIDVDTGEVGVVVVIGGGSGAVSDGVTEVTPVGGGEGAVI